MKGTVKWFNKKKGYGFIIGEDNKEYFVHYSSIICDGFKTLTDGASVRFDVADKDGRTQAVSVVEE